MGDGFGIDLDEFSLDALEDFLTHGDLLPGHRPLREDLEARFQCLKAQGVINVQQLVDTLTTPKALERFAEKTSIPLTYLTLLRRHVRGYIPRPVNFDEIPGLDSAVVQCLADAGIRHTKHFFELARLRVDRAALTSRLRLDEAIMQELIELTDLSRLGWVGPIGVRMFHETGARTVALLAGMDADTLYNRLLEVNRARQYTKVTLARKDIDLTIATAKRLPSAIEY